MLARLTSSTTVTVESNYQLLIGTLVKLLTQLIKKALFKSAFFAFVVFVFSQPAFGFNCDSNSLSAPENAIVKWVYDGDSLLLTDKRKIRIIGIDTPETKHHKQKAQAYGAKAREALRTLLKQFHYQVTLRYDEERKDNTVVFSPMSIYRMAQIYQTGCLNEVLQKPWLFLLMSRWRSAINNQKK